MQLVRSLRVANRVVNPRAKTAEKTKPPRPDYAGRGGLATGTHGRRGVAATRRGVRLRDSGMPTISITFTAAPPRRWEPCRTRARTWSGAERHAASW
jgi:hypothetical protein